SAPTELRDLEVRVEGRIGVLARGGGSVTIADVSIEAVRGIARGVAELDALVPARVEATGRVDGSKASDSAFVRVATGPAEVGACPDPSDCECTPGEVRADASEVCDATGHWATWTATYGIYVRDVASATFTDVGAMGFARW